VWFTGADVANHEGVLGPPVIDNFALNYLSTCSKTAAGADSADKWSRCIRMKVCDKI